MKGLFSRYAGAGGLVALAFLVRLGLTQTIGLDYVYITFFPAVLLAAMLGGVGPGLFATGLSTLLACWFFVPERGQLLVERNADGLGLFGFAATGVVISLVAEGYYGYLRRQILNRDQAVQAQERSEEVLKQAVRVAGLGVFEHDQVTEVVWASPKALELCGLAPDEAMTIPRLLERLHPDDRERIRLAIAKAHDPAGQGDYEVEARFQKPGGPMRWVSVRSQTFFRGEGKERRPIRTVGAVLDITAHREAQEALRGSEAKYRQLVNLLPVAFFACDREGTMQFYNDRAVELWGRKPEPGEVSTVLCGCSRAAHDFEPEALPLNRVIREGAAARDLEGIIERPDGTVANVLVNIDPIRGAGGEIEGAVTVLMDVTDRVRASGALQNQNRRLSLLNAAAARLMSVPEPDVVMPAIYHAIAEFFQTSGFFEFAVVEGQHELVLRTALGVGEPEESCGVKRLKFGEGVVGLVARERKPIVLSHADRLDDSHGTFLKQLRIQAYACYPLMVGERLLGTLSFASRQRERFEPEDQEFFQTLTSYLALGRERARLSEELRHYTENLEGLVAERTAKLRDLVNELEYMSYSIVHDLRAPLRAIQSFAAIISLHEAGRLEERSRELFDRMIAATNRMDLLITDVLNYSKAVAGGLYLRPVNAEALLQDVLQSSPEYQPPRADIRLESPIPGLWADKAGLMQCFSNLLSNSVKFVRPGTTPRIRIEAEMLEGEVRIWFKDEGIGIPSHSREKIFHMFERAHGQEYEGTGMGLALVRKVVEKMGGQVGVESEEGQGSRFWLQFRAAPLGEPHRAPVGSRES